MSLERRRRRTKSAQEPLISAQDFTDSRHGIVFSDRFRYLEENSEAAKSWLEAQNKKTEQYFASLPNLERIQSELIELNNQTLLTEFKLAGDDVVYSLQHSDQAYEILYLQKNDSSEASVLLDPNILWEGENSVDWWQPSSEGKYLAYGVSKGGSEASELHVMRIEDGENLEDVIPDTRSCSLDWLPDETGFYYTRISMTEVGGQKVQCRGIYLHRLGDSWQDDPLIFMPQNPGLEWPFVEVFQHETEEEVTWGLLITSINAQELGSIYIGQCSQDNLVPEIRPVFTAENTHALAQIWRGLLFILTDKDAEKQQILFTNMASLLNQEEISWDTLIPEDPSRLLTWFGFADDYLITHYLNDAKTQIDITNMSTLDDEGYVEKTQLELPEIASVPEAHMAANRPALLYTCEAYDIPKTSVLASFEQTTEGINISEQIVFSTEVPEEYREILSRLKTEQVFYKAKDGTKIPMFITMLPEAWQNENRKTILHGYGGFNTAEVPDFSFSMLYWFAQGNILAVPNIRGGGEYGQDWHRAGANGNKQTSVDDFISAAKYLIKKEYAIPETLGIWGASNGGLLVGAAATQRPDLFGAVVADVGLYDMARFDQLGGLSQYWIDEYGNPNNPEDFEKLLNLSPYHAVTETAYPAILILAGENDTRVAPAHSMKFAAALQEATTSGRPIMLSTNSSGGHSDMKFNDLVAEKAHILAFFEDQLG